MKILITGGYGNLGSWLVSFFVQKGHQVTVLSRKKKTFLDHLPHGFLKADLESESETLSALQSKPFDVVLHTASFNEVFMPNYSQKALMVNTWGTRNLLEALKAKPPKHFIYLSTFHVYGKAQGEITEESPTLPQHDYASTHLFGEIYTQQYALTHQIPYSIIRLTNSYGCPLDLDTSKWYLVLNDLAKMAIEKQEIVLKTNGLASRDFIWMGTVCEVLEKLSNLLPNNQIYNLSEEKTFSILEVAEQVNLAYLEKFGKELPIRTNLEDKNTYSPNLLVSSEKLKRIIPYEGKNKIKEEALKIFGLFA